MPSLNSHVEVTVRGVQHGQAVDNIFNYYLSFFAGASLADLIAVFRGEWRAEVLALVSDQYSVLDYTIKEIEGVVRLEPVNPVSPIALRYSSQATLEGDPDDDKGTLTTAEFPSHVAVGVRKTCDVTTEADLTPIPLERLMRGNWRFGGIIEAQSDDADGNRLNAAAQAAWEGAAGAILQMDSGGTRMQMEVLSLVKGKLPRGAGGPEPYYARATVNEVVVNPYLTSQVSRKQTVAGRG